MRKRSFPTLLLVLSTTTLLTASPAQACLFGLPFLANAPSCNAGTGASSCPTPSQPGGRHGDCLLHRQDLADAAGAMGSMAAGGMQMAGGILRALTDKVLRSPAAEQGL
jgi:hypothetical protein